MEVNRKNTENTKKIQGHAKVSTRYFKVVRESFLKVVVERAEKRGCLNVYQTLLLLSNAIPWTTKSAAC